MDPARGAVRFGASRKAARGQERPAAVVNRWPAPGAGDRGIDEHESIDLRLRGRVAQDDLLDHSVGVADHDKRQPPVAEAPRAGTVAGSSREASHRPPKVLTHAREPRRVFPVLLRDVPGGDWRRAGSVLGLDGGDGGEMQDGRAIPVSGDHPKSTHALVPIQRSEAEREDQRPPLRLRKAEAPPVAVFQQSVRQRLAGTCLYVRRHRRRGARKLAGGFLAACPPGPCADRGGRAQREGGRSEDRTTMATPHGDAPGRTAQPNSFDIEPSSGWVVGMSVRTASSRGIAGRGGAALAGTDRIRALIRAGATPGWHGNHGRRQSGATKHAGERHA